MAARRSLRASIKFIGAVEDEWQLYSDNASDYSLGQPIGFGASSMVYQADYHPSTGGSIPCALKVLDLDSLPMSSLRLLRRETQLMSLSKHPNVLRVRGTWMDGHKLYIAMRLMRSGSAADVIHYGWQRGVEEDVAKCILKQALQGLNYLHINGFIHRDVKCANLLIDDDGTVLLGDLGVAAALDEEESIPIESTVTSHSMPERPPLALRGKARLGRRKSFVGTPCWMAPEVISQKNYDSKADIWSLGITALELAEGRAPRSREPPQKVLMKTIQDEPPTLDPERAQFKYSKAFKEFVEGCLSKDPSKRPTAEELLQSAYFKASKKKDYLVRTMLQGLPPLVERQERRRVPSALAHVSLESWHFTQGGVTSPSSPISARGVHEDGIFEMEEAKEVISAFENDTSATTSSHHVQLMDAQRRTQDSPLGELTDEAVSTPATSLLSSSPIQPRLSHSVKMESTLQIGRPSQSPSPMGASPSSPSPSFLLKGAAPSSPSPSNLLKGTSPSTPPSPSLRGSSPSSSSYKLWRRLRGKNSKTPLK